jgi:RNA recognition motif-containing protein
MRLPLPQPTSKERLDTIKRDLESGYLPLEKTESVATVFVGNLPFKYTEHDLDQLFAEYGVVDSVVIRDREQQSRGFGFVGVCKLLLCVSWPEL